MLYFIHGDSKKIFKKATNLVEGMLSKKPEALVLKMDLDNWSSDKIKEFIKSHSLFSQKYIVLLSRFSENKEIFEDIISFLPEIQNSENIFIWFEKEIDAKNLKKIEKKATQVQFFNSKKESKRKTSNIFDLAQAIGIRDRKKAWVLYTSFLKEFPPEEIYGIIWWQFKTMILVSQTNSASEAGLKDFSYLNTKKFCQNYSKTELDVLATKLIRLYHDSRLINEDLGLNLERFILSI